MANPSGFTTPDSVAFSDSEIDPGEALRQLLRSAEELIGMVEDAHTRWLEEYPLARLLEEWNTDTQQYNNQMFRYIRFDNLRQLLNNRLLDKVSIQNEIDIIYQNSGNKNPQWPNRDLFRPIRKWEELLRPVGPKMQQLEELRRAALPLAGFFENRDDRETQGQLDDLIQSCKELKWFIPIRYARYGSYPLGEELKLDELEAAIKAERYRLHQNLVGCVRGSMSPLADLLAIYRGKRNPIPGNPGGALGRTNGGSLGNRPGKGKNIDARMLKVMAENPESHGWSARDWAAHLGCSDGTVKGTKTWRVRLKAVKATAAADAANKMDRSGTRTSGKRKAQHKSDA